MSAVEPAQPSDEERHPVGEGDLWAESWYLDFTDAAGQLGGYVRLGLYPNQQACWYWACLVGEGRPLVTVIDHDVPVPSARSLEVRTEGLWADYTVETALDHVSVGVEAFALGLDDPAEVYGDPRGDRVPFGLDLEWETDGGTYAYPGVSRYEVPCRVHGEVLVGQERIELDGWGQRDHSWGERDWWSYGWIWSAGRLDDGTRFHATHVAVGDAVLYTTGYVQPPGEPMRAVGLGTDVEVRRSQVLGPAGLPTAAAVVLGDLSVDVEPVAFAPVLLTAADGRRSRFPRALCRFHERGGAGRSGVGWMEWNQPEG